MAIESALLDKIIDKLGVGRSRIYQLIVQTSQQHRLPPRQAALYLAADNGINISKFASPEDWDVLRRSSEPLAAPASPPAPATPLRRSTPRRNTKKSKRRNQGKRGKKIWVVQGRNRKLNRAMESFLRTLGLDPMEFLKAAKKPSAHISEILETAFDKAAAVVVLLTPDDVGKLRKQFLQRDDEDYEKKLTPQARQNVIFEAGMAFGRNPDNVVIVEFGKLRKFTDVSGRHVVRMNDSGAKRKELIQKLRLAGCDVDDSGLAWIDEGDFTV